MAQTKWKNLRDYFRRELKKIPVLRGGDLSGDVSDKCHWPQFKSLMFLKDQFEFVPKQSRSNLASLDDNAAVFNDSQSQMSAASCDESKDPLEEDQSLYTESSHSPTPAQSSSNSNQFDQSKTSTLNRARKRNYIGTLIELEQQKLELLAETKTDDEHQCFFKSLLPHVRRIRSADILEFRNEVQNLVQKYAYPESGMFTYEDNYEIKHSHTESYENGENCEDAKNANNFRNYKQ